MKYKSYNPEREVIEKFLSSARSEILHVFERIDLADLSKEDREKIVQIKNMLNDLINKLKVN